MIRPLLCPFLWPTFAGLLLLSACQSPSPALFRSATGPGGAQSSRADAATQAFCRQRAEEVYTSRNRGALYQSDSRDSPFSASYVPSVTSRGLSDRYAMDEMVADCIRNTGERSNPTAPQDVIPPPPPPPPPGARARAPTPPR